MRRDVVGVIEGGKNVCRFADLAMLLRICPAVLAAGLVSNYASQHAWGF